MVRPDGSGRRRLTTYGVDASQGLSSLYSWLPDGRRIAYIRTDGLAVVDVAAGRTQLAWRSKHLIAQYPYLVDESNNNGAGWGVVVARADGTAPAQAGVTCPSQ